MTTPRGDVDAAVAGLQARWGAAAPRVVGALALAAEPAPADVSEPTDARPSIGPLPGIAPPPGERVIHTGFAALDAILGPGGLPTSASVAIRGDGSSGRTTLALRTAAEAQVAGSVVAWLDLSRSFDPVEAVARGIRLEWLVVITPASLDEGLRIAGSLLAGRSVDLLVLDLPGGRLARTDTPAKIADRLHRLAALARRAETLLLILDAPRTSGPAGGGLATAVDQATGIRLELARRSWVRLGRDVVGQRTEALVAHNRHGPPGRRATLRILYAEGGERDACLAHDALLIDALEVAHDPGALAPPVHAPAPEAPDREIHDHATSPPLRAAPAPGPGTGPTLRAVPAGPARPGRPAMGSRPGHRREPGRAGAGRPPRPAPGERASTRP
jgi:RecA/RadA recombinase